MPPIIQISKLDKYFGRLHVLKKISIDVAPREVVCIIGRSGSGKSTLIRECLLPSVNEALKARKAQTAASPDDLAGWESIAAVYEVDQSPIGRTPRSIPATYVGFFDTIRQLFAQLPEARLRGSVH